MTMASAGDDATAASSGQKEAMERIEMNTISHSKTTTNENDVPKTDASKTEHLQVVTSFFTQLTSTLRNSND